MLSSSEIDTLVSSETGEIDRKIFSSQEIFDLEMEQIFGRAWLFLCHESQIKKPGDFFEAPMGRDNVLVVRQRDGSIKAMLNTCMHRGNAVCRAEEGNARNFMCTYHGWTYGLDGELMGVPGLEKFYSGDLDRSKYGLRQVAQLDSYEGFVFATLDPTAPPLYDFLGETGRLGIHLIAAQGEMEVVPGIQKFVIDCNWKFTVDNLFDWYHPQITHISAFETPVLAPQDSALADASLADAANVLTPEGADLGVEWQRSFIESLIVLGEYGHAIGGPSTAGVGPTVPMKWRETEKAKKMLPGVAANVAGHPNIFPTMWITQTVQVSLRVPRTPTTTEIWWFSFRDANADPEQGAAQLAMQNHVFGPAGLLEQEDGENWAQSTMTAIGGAQESVPQLLKMNLGRGKIIHQDGLARIEGNINEHGQMWTYLAWKAWLSGASWDELKQVTTPGDIL
ncbi:aromatic ring-hydroxylating oxygenase subunit alpha [Dactylosporangium sp. CA-233914]|uniref:aromatic ring-hydroxylating oxygenase subunit alpha n=1 Tax=Dactylosporangium sp. CA-233914 TaxID=3239934 RepID=UPI003D935D0F